MKITIDTDKTPHQIKIEGTASLGELIEFLSKYYPDFTWKDVRIGDATTLRVEDWMLGQKHGLNPIINPMFPGVTHNPNHHTGAGIIYKHGDITTSASGEAFTLSDSTGSNKTKK